MFDLSAWINRCKTCQHVSLDKAIGTVCNKKGCCEYVPKPQEPEVIEEVVRGVHKKRSANADGLYTCPECGELKPKEQMSIMRRNDKEYIGKCKHCKSQIDAARARERRAKRREGKPIRITYNEKGEKFCASCEQYYPNDGFYTYTTLGSTRLTSYCKKCTNIRNYLYIKQRREKDAEI